MCSFIINRLVVNSRSSRPEVFCKKAFLWNFAKFTGKHLCQCPFFWKSCRPQPFIKRETQTQMFSCEFCEITKNAFLYRTTLVVASASLCYDFLKCCRFALKKLWNILIKKRLHLDAALKHVNFLHVFCTCPITYEILSNTKSSLMSLGSTNLTKEIIDIDQIYILRVVTSLI